MILKNEQNLSELVKEGIVLLDFNGTWCNPCKMLSPIVDTLEGEMTDVKFIKVDIDEFPELAVEYNVSSIPTLKIFKKGEEVETSVGFTPKALLEAKLNSHRQ